jgi:bla regulator protein blaR1
VSSKTFDLTRVLFFIWAFVSTVLLLRFAKNLFEIYQKIQRNERVFYQSSTIVLLKEAVLPCTFMQYIFVQKEDFDNQQFEPELLQHEQCHVQQLHTLDVILLEVFQVLFWFNPVVYLFKNAIKLNHEFLADDAVNQQNKDIPFYQRLLLTKAMAGNLQLTSSSTFQLTKQRLIMMTKHTSATVATLKIMLTVALTALIALGFSSRLSAQKQETKKNSLPVKQENKKATTAPTQKTKLPTEGEWIATARSSEALTLDDVDYKNGEYIITRDFVKPKKWEKIVKIKNKRYDELTEAERQKIGILLYTEKNGPPTEEQFRNWSSSDVYGVWVNDKRIENAQLKKYKREDIVQHGISRLYKNAQVGNRRWQIGMMTKEYYEKYIADFKANPHISIDMRTKK